MIPNKPAMRTRIIVVAAALVLALGVPAAGGTITAGRLPVCVTATESLSRCPSWASGYDYPGGGRYIGQQKARATVVSPDGSRVFVTGSIVDDATGVDYGTVAYDTESGALLWAAQHDGPSHFHDRAYSLAVSADGGRVFVSGSEITEVGEREVGDFATVAYDAATGEELWVVRYDGPLGGDDRATKVAASPDGSRVFVMGGSPAASGTREFATAAYDAATGQEIWVARYADAAAFSAVPSDLAVSADGSHVFVTGAEYLDAASATSAYATIVYDAERGDRQWVARHTGPGAGLHRPSAIAIAPGGTPVFVTGTGPAAEGDDDYATLAYDAATGDQIWEARYDAGRRRDTAAALAVAPSGDRVFVTGSSMAAPSDGVEATVSPFRIDATTVAYEASSGAQVWEARFASTAHHAQETGRAIGVSPDGSRLFVAGFTMPASGGEPTDPTTFGGCSSSDGYEGSLGGTDRMGSFLTVAYQTSTGAQDWYATFNSSTNNPAGFESGGVAALGMSPDGKKVYVAGTFAHLYADSCTGPPGLQNYSDYWTVAYPTDLQLLGERRISPISERRLG